MIENKEVLGKTTVLLDYMGINVRVVKSEFGVAYAVFDIIKCLHYKCSECYMDDIRIDGYSYEIKMSEYGGEKGRVNFLGEEEEETVINDDGLYALCCCYERGGGINFFNWVHEQLRTKRVKLRDKKIKKRKEKINRVLVNFSIPGEEEVVKTILVPEDCFGEVGRFEEVFCKCVNEKQAIEFGEYILKLNKE